MRTLKKRGRPRVALEDRFWAKVRKAGPDECWEWTASKFGHGYGQIARGGEHGGVMPAHRASYEIEHGPIPRTIWVLHRCDNPGCVNPRHLFLGTVADNNRDRDQKGRTANGLTGRAQKLTAADVRTVVHLYASGVSQEKMAPRFGVAQTTISAILRGRSWRCVTKITPSQTEEARL